jgi:hypothetical protein
MAVGKKIKESHEHEVVEGASSKLGALSKTVAEMLSFQKEGPSVSVLETVALLVNAIPSSSTQYEFACNKPTTTKTSKNDKLWRLLTDW